MRSVIPNERPAREVCRGLALKYGHVTANGALPVTQDGPSRRARAVLSPLPGAAADPAQLARSGRAVPPVICSFPGGAGLYFLLSGRRAAIATSAVDRDYTGYLCFTHSAPSP